MPCPVNNGRGTASIKSGDQPKYIYCRAPMSITFSMYTYNIDIRSHYFLPTAEGVCHMAIAQIAPGTAVVTGMHFYRSFVDAVPLHFRR